MEKIGGGCLLPVFKVGFGELGENYAALYTLDLEIRKIFICL